MISLRIIRQRSTLPVFRLALGAIGAVASAFTVMAQTVVDDFSADHIAANYTLMTGAIDGGTTITVSSGTLQLQNNTDYSSYIWNGPGNTSLALANVGDSVSIQLQVTAGAEGGLTLWKTNIPVASVGAEEAGQLSSVRYTTSTQGGATHGLFLNDGSIYTQLDGAPNGFSTLTISIAAKTLTDTTISFVFSGTGFTTISGSDTYAFINPIYFGPSLYRSTVQYDNLTFTSAIPEPSATAALAGFAAMVLALGLRRRGETAGDRA